MTVPDRVTWRFEIPGQPPSWNASYKIVRKYRTTTTGKKVPFHTLAKEKPVIEYQDGARLIIQAAKPSRWAPDWQVRVYYWFFLSRDMDCDNIMKAINDSIEQATGVNDKRFLPCAMMKVIVPKAQAKVRVTIVDPGSDCAVLPLWGATQTP